MDFDFNPNTFGGWLKKFALKRVDGLLADLKSSFDEIFDFLKAFGVGGDGVKRTAEMAASTITSVKTHAASLGDTAAREAATLAEKAAKNAGVKVARDAQPAAPTQPEGTNPPAPKGTGRTQ